MREHAKRIAQTCFRQCLQRPSARIGAGSDSAWLLQGCTISATSCDAASYGASDEHGYMADARPHVCYHVAAPWNSCTGHQLNNASKINSTFFDAPCDQRYRAPLYLTSQPTTVYNVSVRASLRYADRRDCTCRRHDLKSVTAFVFGPCKVCSDLPSERKTYSRAVVFSRQVANSKTVSDDIATGRPRVSRIPAFNFRLILRHGWLVQCTLQVSAITEQRPKCRLYLSWHSQTIMRSAQPVFMDKITLQCLHSSTNVWWLLTQDLHQISILLH